MKQYLLFLIFFSITMSAQSQTHYLQPPPGVVRILDAPPPPLVSMSPRRDAMLFIEYQPNPSLEFIARPVLRIAGIRITPAISARQRITQYTGAFIRFIGSGREVRLQIPEHSSIGIPVWSYDGKTLAFTRDGDHGVELWTAPASTGKAARVPDLLVNDVIDDPFEWMSDNTTLLVRAVPANRGAAPKAPAVPEGPNIEETHGKVSKTPTYQDLLKTPYDEQLFEYYARTQLVLLNTATGSPRPIGNPGLIASSRFSPDDRYLLVTKLRRPFSYRVTFEDFSRSVEVWNAKGDSVAAIADFPVTDQIPTQGVQTGPREMQWQPLKNATLIWTEALDDGDPLKKVAFREKIMMLDAPFSAGAREIMRLKHRYVGFQWLQDKNRTLVTEFDRDRRWRTTSLLSLDAPDTRTVLFDLSVNDAYANPGSPVMQTDMIGTTTIVQDGEWIYLSGAGASDAGDHPFLDKMNLMTKEKQRLFHSEETSYERFIAFVGSSRTSIVTRHESKTEPPNYFLRDLTNASKSPLTDIKDPAPELTGMKKTLLKYKRSDGVPLSGTLYLPPGYDGTSRLPLVVWAYPLEYSDASTAGQVRGSMHTFTYFRGTSPLFFVTQGYAVLMDATMPVVGDPETMNDTFIEQIVDAAKSAIDTLDAAGVVDKKRVLVGGHSYGAFMTANLLAHSDLFAAGIARSGAYNRTLTPFGFQSERRSFWEARDIYMNVSPFTYANKIRKPILLIHGEADNNTGTFPLQSERLFNAIKGNGGTARLVMLPYESHGYSARESVFHVLAESFAWADKYVKNYKGE